MYYPALTYAQIQYGMKLHRLGQHYDRHLQAMSRKWSLYTLQAFVGSSRLSVNGYTMAL